MMKTFLKDINTHKYGVLRDVNIRIYANKGKNQWWINESVQLVWPKNLVRFGGGAGYPAVHDPSERQQAVEHVEHGPRPGLRNVISEVNHRNKNLRTRT